MYWRVKTARRRQLPLTREMKSLFERLIGSRKAGFVFLNREFLGSKRKPATQFGSDVAFRQRLQQICRKLADSQPETTEKDLRRAVMTFNRKMGQIPVKRIQHEFCSLTQQIGCPQFTRAHDLRHLFSSRAQEEGTNPLLVQEILGHTTLTMTKRYTHLGMDAKRQALERLNVPEASDNGGEGLRKTDQAAQ